MKGCKTRRSGGRFSAHVDALARLVAERHGLSVRRCRKLIGQSMTDARIIETVMEYVTRVVTGRGDGLTLIDVCENLEFDRVSKRKKAVSVKDVTKIKRKRSA